MLTLVAPRKIVDACPPANFKNSPFWRVKISLAISGHRMAKWRHFLHWSPTDGGWPAAQRQAVPGPKTCFWANHRKCDQAPSKPREKRPPLGPRKGRWYQGANLIHDALLATPAIPVPASCSLAFYVPWKWAALGFTGAGNVQAAVAIGNPLEGHYPHSHHYLSLALPAALMITRISARASADSPGHASVTIARAASISEFAPSAPHFAPPGF